MTTTTENGYQVLRASEGHILRRIHDGFEMGSEIVLGFDYSTGEKREDKGEYYEEVEKPVLQGVKDVLEYNITE